MTYRGTKVDDMIQDETDRRLANLASVSSKIKEVSLDIHADVNTSNDFLVDFNQTIASTQSMLRGTMNRFTEMTETATGKKMFYFILACIVGFLVLYFGVEHYRSSSS